MSKSWKLVLTTTLLVGTVRCGNPPLGPPASTETSASSQAPRTIFSAKAIAIWSHDARVPPPLIPGSLQPRLVSESPGIVSIDSDGKLHTHQDGEAIVRAASGSSLLVRVHSVRHLAISPEQVELPAGAALDLTAMADATALPPEDVEWSIDSPEVASIVDGRLTAVRPGRATIFARASISLARAQLVVRAAKPVRSISLLGPVAPVRAKSVFQVQPQSPPPGVVLDWVASDSRVLKPISNGVFQAMQHGRADACLRTTTGTSCIPIRVE